MRIAGISATLPQRRVTNEEVLQEIAEQSRSGFSGNLERTLKFIRRGLSKSGSNTRAWRDKGESSLELTLRACKDALAQIDDPSSIDLVISASVYGELFEPATANLIAHKLGLDDAEAFDLKEACDGWMKAAKVAYAMIESGMKKRVLVVNGEFPITPGFGIYPDLFKLSSEDDLEWRFPGFTLGEAATATVFEVGEANGWRFSNITRNDLYDLCTITMPWSENYSPRLKQSPGLFASYGADLRKYGFPIAVEMFKKTVLGTSETDILFTHSSSKSDWRDGAVAVGLGNKIYDVYADYGNVVSAAVPTGMALAAKEGLLRRGNKVATWVASAGMSFSTAHFVF